MSSRSRRICKQIMQYLIDHGYTNEAARNIITQAIVYVRGRIPPLGTKHQPRHPCNEHFDICRGLMCVFKLHLEAYPELLVKAIVADEHQKKLL